MVRGGRSEPVEGTLNERHVVIEFDSFDAAMTAYNDPEYQRIAQIRRDTATSQIIVVEGT